MQNRTKVIEVAILLLLVLQVASAVKCNGLDTEDDCATCCDNSTPKLCTTDILKCPLNPNPDFSVLVTILYILGGFIIGIPLVLFIIDKIFCSNLFNCKMSVCECIANYICCYCCLSIEKPPIEFEDIEEQENLDNNKQKKPSNKVAPEQK